jgi:hypothetical protein
MRANRLGIKQDEETQPGGHERAKNQMLLPLSNGQKLT